MFLPSVLGMAEYRLVALELGKFAANGQYICGIEDTWETMSMIPSLSRAYWIAAPMILSIPSGIFRR